MYGAFVGLTRGDICGREASEAYATKNKGRPHSAQADVLLARYRVGTLAAD
jgi:hypothetical protein